MPILVISAHADDAELGCGATIARLSNAGAKVHSLVMSLRRNACPEGYDDQALIHEVVSAHSVLGVASENLVLHDFENREFHSMRQEILDVLVQSARSIRPTLVFTTSPNDFHQDHKVVSSETLRAFKFTSILGYEMPWNMTSQRYDVFVTLDEHLIDKKLLALSKYQSQIVAGRPMFDPEYLRALAIVRGQQIAKPTGLGSTASVTYAECFELVRAIF